MSEVRKGIMHVLRSSRRFLLSKFIWEIASVEERQPFDPQARRRCGLHCDQMVTKLSKPQSAHIVADPAAV